MTTKVFCLGTMPDNLVAEWLQHLRDFDCAHPGCHFETAMGGGSLTADEMEQMLKNIDPPFSHLHVARKQ